MQYTIITHIHVHVHVLYCMYTVHSLVPRPLPVFNDTRKNGKAWFVKSRAPHLGERVVEGRLSYVGR